MEEDIKVLNSEYSETLNLHRQERGGHIQMLPLDYYRISWLIQMIITLK